MKTSDFSLNNYSKLIRALLEKKYNFVTFSEYCTGVMYDNYVVLRHDVDELPQNALTIARLEHSLGVRASYYFRKKEGAFEVDFIRKIAALGHEIGYHYEDFSSSNGDIFAAYDSFKKNLNELRSIAPVSTIAMHGAPRSFYDNRFIWLLFDYKKLNLLGETYLTPDFTNVAYLSDTGGYWNDTRFSVRDKTEDEINMPSFGSTLEIIHAIQSGAFPKKAIILSHPQRWFDNVFSLFADRVLQDAKNVVKRLIINNKKNNTTTFKSLKLKINEWLDGCLFSFDYDAQKASLAIKNFFLFPVSGKGINDALVELNGKLALNEKVLFSSCAFGKMSKAEFLGRLYYCGFDVDSVECLNGYYFAFALKVKDVHHAPEIHYGIVIKLPRVGIHGNWFYVYKLRSMYPYSEFLQDYLSKNVTLKEGGKYADDFRITKTGKWLRRIWIDEIPNLYNIIRGDMKFVGVRPLSKTYYNLYDEDLKVDRLKYKPGLLPPFYADNPITLDDIQNSERKYLDAVEKYGLKQTDWAYFKKIVYNILFKHRRSA